MSADDDVGKFSDLNTLVRVTPDYLKVDKVLLNGEETQITFPYISGHFDNTNHGRSKAKPYVCNGKVYINASFISWLYE